MIVLDTHVLIWLIDSNEKIKKSGFLPEIDKSLHNGSIYVPAISTWEIAMLAAKNRISLNENTLDWILKATSAPGISICPLTPEIAHESTVLPGDFHGDPADRIIIATARILDATLLTLDKQILEYSKKGFLKTAKTKIKP